jgi:hypothetical protein
VGSQKGEDRLFARRAGGARSEAEGRAHDGRASLANFFYIVLLENLLFQVNDNP